MKKVRAYSGIRSEVSRFRRWGRKGYSVFQSLNREVIIGCLLTSYLSLSSSEKVCAQQEIIYVNKEINLDEVVISAQRTPVNYSQVARVVTVIEKEEIISAPVQCLQDLLEYALNVDVRQRGNHGVQADVSIRGGSFDQTMILLNGVNITDPQSGHLSMNLPIELESIERVEILKGPAARVFGPNAFSGAINFITGTEKRNSLKVSVMGGEYGLYSLSAGTTYLTGPLKSYLAVSRRVSDGYQENTDFKSSNVYYQGQLNTSAGILDFQLGYTEKGFGANSFYTPAYPDQYEKNRTTLASLRLSTKGKVNLSPVLYWRRNQDRFELFRNETPNWYSGHNYHLTDVCGAGVNASFRFGLGKVSCGLEFRSENILSNKLGESMEKEIKVSGESGIFYTNQHNRNNLSCFLEYNIYLNRFTFSGGGLANCNSDQEQGVEFYPGADISYKLSNNFKWFASLNFSLRMPTYTDLYYVGPTNLGNPDLKPEQATTYESGFKYKDDGWRFHASFFRREGKNMIDWVKLHSEDKWESQNITRINTLGIEFSSFFKLSGIMGEFFPVRSVNMSYSYMKMDKSSDEYISSYVLDNLKHKFNADINYSIYKYLGGSWRLSYQDREGGFIWYDRDNSTYTRERPYEPFWSLDMRLYYQRSNYTIYIEGSNILNQEYYDLGNVTQPGRWIRGGVKMRLFLASMQH